MKIAFVLLAVFVAGRVAFEEDNFDEEVEDPGM